MRSHLCAVTTCRAARWHTSKFCKKHYRTMLWYGHPEQDAIPQPMITESVKVAERWLHDGSDRRSKLRERPTLQPALSALGLLLDPTRCNPEKYANTREALQALARPRMRQDAKKRRPAVSPLEALRIVLAVAHIQSIAPSRFYPDNWGREAGTVFWRQAAWALLRSRMQVVTRANPLRDGTVRIVKAARPYERAGMDWLTHKLRAACAPVIAAWLIEREKEKQMQQDQWKTEREKYEAPKPVTNEYQEPSYEERLLIWRKKLDGAKGDYTKRMQLMASMPTPPKEHRLVAEISAPWQIARQVTPDYIPQENSGEQA